MGRELIPAPKPPKASPSGGALPAPVAEGPMFLLTQLWCQRGLVWALTVREWRNRYAGSLAGLAWPLLQPLMMLGIYALVFQYVFQVRPPQDHADQPYLLWVAVTLWPWLAFSEALTRGAGAVVTHGALIKKVALPRAAPVVAAVFSTLAMHAMGYVLVLALLCLGGAVVSPAVLPMALWAWLVLGGAALGLGLALSALHVFLRDVEPLLGQTLTLWFYASPVLYPLAMVPLGLRRVMQFNPIAHVLEPLRTAALGLGEVSLGGLAWAVLLAATVLLGGAWVFQRLSPFFEDQL